MTAKETALTAEDVAEELQIGLSKAYEILKEMPRLKHGKTLRVTRTVFARWKEANTVPACRASTEPRTDTTTSSFEGSVDLSRRKTKKLPSLRLVTSSDAQPIRPIQPRTKPRSHKPSKPSSTGNASAGSRRGR